jgi:hypothetical protein
VRSLLFAVALFVTAGLAYRWRCGWTHETRTKPTPMGGRRCTHPGCGRAYADLAESGEIDGAYLNDMRTGVVDGAVERAVRH